MDRRVFIGLFLFALILRFAAFDFFFLRSGPEGLHLVDAAHYTTLAKNIVEGNGFSLSRAAPYEPDAYRVPGYPLFLALFYKLFGAFWPANVAQVFLNSFIPVMIAWLAWKLSANARIALAAGFLTAVEPHLIYHQVGIATEGLFTFLLALFCAAVVRYLNAPSPRRALAVGALFAVSTFTRPYFLYFLPAAVVFLLFPLAWREWKRMAFFTVLFLIPSLFVLFPWMARNERMFGVLTLSTSGWYNIYTRLAATVAAAATHQPFAPVFNNFIAQLKDDGVIAEGRDEELYHPRVAPELKKRALAVFKQYPLQTFLLQPLSVQAIFTHDNSLTMLNELKLVSYPERPRVPLSMALLQDHPFKALRDTLPYYFRGGLLFTLLMRVVWFALLIFAVVGVYALLAIRDKQKKAYAAFVAALVAFFVLVTLPIGAAIDARMRMVFEPEYFIFAAAGLVLIAGKVKNKAIKQ